MRKEIQINPSGSPISVNVKIYGVVVAGYHLQLFESNSSNVISNYSGTNEFDDDDFRTLPNNAEKNIDRVLMLDSSIAKVNKNTEDISYEIHLEIYQDGNLIDSAIDQNQLDASTSVQNSLILVKLIA